MSGLTLILIVAFIAVFIWIKVDENKNWKTLFEFAGQHSQELTARYNYLKRQGIRCKLKNYNPGTIRMMGMQGTQMSKQGSILLQVHKKDEEKAMKIMADFEAFNE